MKFFIRKIIFLNSKKVINLINFTFSEKKSISDKIAFQAIKPPIPNK